MIDLVYLGADSVSLATTVIGSQLGGMPTYQALPRYLATLLRLLSLSRRCLEAPLPPTSPGVLATAVLCHFSLMPPKRPLSSPHHPARRVAPKMDCQEGLWCGQGWVPRWQAFGTDNWPSNFPPSASIATVHGTGSSRMHSKTVCFSSASTPGYRDRQDLIRPAAPRPVPLSWTFLSFFLTRSPPLRLSFLASQPYP